MLYRMEISNQDLFEILESLWLNCKKNNEYPTQIVFGSNIFAKALRNKRFKEIFFPMKRTLFQDSGFVGKIQDIEILTDFYIEDESTLSWSIPENVLIFNIGQKLKGNL